MNSKLFMSNKILILPIIVFTVFVLLNLTKEPIPGGDEVFFASIAHYQLDRNEFSNSEKPFTAQLSPPGKFSLLIMHPPFYLWLIAITTHFFGFNIYTVRLTSFLIGLLLLFFFFSILKKITNNGILVLAVLFLFAVDVFFIRSSRFGRPDILTIFFITLSLLFYIKTLLEEDNTKNYFLAGLFSGFSFMTHLALGLIPLVLINLHFILTKRFKRSGFNKLLFLIMPALVFFIVWLTFIVLPIWLHNSGNFKDTLSIFAGRISGKKDFYFVLRTTIFYIYLSLLFFVLFFLRNKNGIKSFLILAYLFIYPYIILIGTLWYSALLTSLACLTFVCLIKEGGKYKILFLVFLAIAIGCNITSQRRIIKKRTPFSYQNYSEQVAAYLPTGAKVLMGPLDPDPYFWLASHRKDLRLEVSSGVIPDKNLTGDRAMEAIKTADYIILGHLKEKKYSDYLKFLVSYAENYSQSSVSLSGKFGYPWEQVIFNMKRTTD